MSSDSYLGASDAQQIYPENTVDFIAVQNGISQYRLSQDVPGGYEGNVLVVKNGSVLRPEAEYSIDYSAIDLMYNLITFQIPVYSTDQIYVVHKGVATYNMTPSPRSVTDDALSENLRAFVFETFDGGDDEYILIKQEWHPRSLLVYVDGAVQRPYLSFIDTPPYTLPTVDGTWDFALVKVDDATSKIVFAATTPIGTKNVSVLHLAFSTVLRRSDYLTSITLSPNLIATAHIQDNAVNGQKILLENDEYLRSKNSSAVPIGVIKLNSSDQIDILGQIILDSTIIEPVTNNQISLGSIGKRYKKVWSVDIDNSGTVTSDDIVTDTITANSTTDLKGDVTIGQVSTPVNCTINGIDANIDCTGDVTLSADGDVSVTGDTVAVVANDFTVNGLHLEGIPLGVVLPYYGTALPGDPSSKWLFCDGSAIPGDSKYDGFKLWLATQGLPNINVPNLKQKFPYGRDGSLPGGSGGNVGDNVGSTTHSHPVNDHSHNLTSTNAPIVDSGHTHTVTGSVTLPSHTHSLYDHYHILVNHVHTHDYRHEHTINTTTSIGEADAAHTHTANYRVDYPLFGGTTKRNYLVRKQTGLESESISDDIPSSPNRHRHGIAAKTDPQGIFFQNWGNDLGLKATSTTRNSSTWATFDVYTNNTKKGSYPSSDSWSVTNVPNYTPPQTATVNFNSSTATSSIANSTISGRTETKTSLTTQNNSSPTVPVVPGFTLNFIIRAIA